jgi:hypothetical protein
MSQSETGKLTRSVHGQWRMLRGGSAYWRAMNFKVPIAPTGVVDNTLIDGTW